MLDDVRRNPITERELASAKAAIVGGYAIGTQTFAAQSGELAVLGVYGMPLDEPYRYLERVKAITAEEVRVAAEKYLTPEYSALGIVRGGAGEA